MRYRGDLHEYRVLGQALRGKARGKAGIDAAAHGGASAIYEMRIFAPDHVTAKSRFWHYMKALKKVKKANGEIIQCRRVVESNPSRKVKNYGIWLRYRSRTGEHNMYKEYRDLTAAGGVTQCFREMGGQHRAQAGCITVLRVETVDNEKVRRPHLKQFLTSNLKFPLPRLVNRRLHAPRFTTSRPKTFF